MKDLALAKLNLSLNVGKVKGKFHEVDSIVVTVSCFDIVKVKKRRDKAVTLRGCKNIPLEQNTAYIAACEFVRRFGTNGCNIKISKEIPVGAGMGGSSADAACVVRCLCSLYGVDIENPQVHNLCEDIGSDINFLLHGDFARMRGKGDDLQFGELAKDIYFAVTCFNASVSTKDVYARFDEVGSGESNCDNAKLFALLEEGRVAQAIAMFGNGLQKASLSLSDYAKGYLEFCAQRGLPCHMTGSGSAFYVACESLDKALDIQNLLKTNGFDTFVCQTFF